MLNITQIPLNDEKVWDMICEGRVKGCFQIESQLCKTWCKKIKPRSIKEMSDLLALVRPGCVSGDTLISIKKQNYKEHIEKSNRYLRVSIRELFQNRKKYKNIISYDEYNSQFIENGMLDIFYNGEKECFKVKIRKYSMGMMNNGRTTDWYNLECTADHKLLTPHGWVELKDLKIGDRLAVVKRIRIKQKPIKQFVASRHVPGVLVENIRGLKYFSEICYKNYEEKCVICGYNKTTIDTHHIDGNRHKDNSPENLCFLCPNHHREYENGIISKEELLSNRDKYKLTLSDSIEWATFVGAESVGVKDVYDISMESPYHNFIAGNFVVHNCLRYVYDGKSMTQHYADRKNGISEAKPIDESLVDILASTQQIITYQEQIINIARKIAGFNDGQSRSLQKSIGKKDAELLFSLEKEFVSGCVNVGIVSEDRAKLIFENIKKSARYLFNLSHSIQYTHITYWTAYLKYYYPLKFYLHKLKLADDKIDPLKEVKELIMSAKSDGIKVYGPSLKLMNENFEVSDGAIYFGFCNVKNVGQAEFNKIKSKLKSVDDWYNLLINYLLSFNKRTIDNLIYVGTFDIFGKSRLEMLHELSCLRELSEPELKFLQKFAILDKDDLILALMKTALPKKEGGGCSNKNRIEIVKDIITRLKNPGRSLWDSPAILAKAEANLLGCEISFSEIDSCKDASYANCTCLDFANKNHPKSVVLAVTITSYREIETKNKEKMCFLTVEDGSGDLENIIVFPNIYSEYGDIIYEGATVLLQGSRSNKNDDSFIVESIELI